MSNVTAQLERATAQAKQFAQDAMHQTFHRADTALQRNQQCIRDHPFFSLLTALIVGVVVGAVFSQACVRSGKLRS